VTTLGGVSSGRGQPGLLHPPVERVRRAADEAGVLQADEQAVHRLAGDETPTGQLGVTQPRQLSQNGQNRVLRHRQPQRTQRSISGAAHYLLEPLRCVRDPAIKIRPSSLRHVSILT
jgi:hypothetical protein